MKRYLAVYCKKGNWQDQVRSVLNEEIWSIEKNPPETPYVQLKIKVVKQEQRYSKQSIWKERYFKLFGFTFCVSVTGSKRRKK